MEETVKTKLTTALLIKVLEDVVDRLDLIADRYEQLFGRSDKFFSDMRQQFLQEIIKEAVDLELEKTKRGRVAKYHG